MIKRIGAVIAAITIPFLLFVLVIGLNESDNDRNALNDNTSHFDVETKHQVNKPKPKPKPKKRNRPQAEALPSIKPENVSRSLSGNGLSFGVPQFDEAEFSELQNTDLLGDASGGAMDKSTVDTPPRVLKRSPIVYPELARKQGVSGYVTMNVLIDESGNVENVEVVEAKPKDMFELKAESTIRQWRFEPATYNGKKVKVWALQKIVFKLD